MRLITNTELAFVAGGEGEPAVPQVEVRGDRMGFFEKLWYDLFETTSEERANYDLDQRIYLQELKGDTCHESFELTTGGDTAKLSTNVIPLPTVGVETVHNDSKLTRKVSCN